MNCVDFEQFFWRQEIRNKLKGKAAVKCHAE